jgi:spore coat protein U-like protein
MFLFNRSLFYAALASAAMLAAAQASAKCTVTLKLTNTDTHEITVLGNDSQARINGLTWSKMNFANVTLAPSATDSVSWTLNQSCGGNAKRDLRFKYLDSSNGVKYEKLVDNRDIDDGQTYAFSMGTH